MSVVVGVLETIPKSLGKRLKVLKINERVETIKTTALLRSVGILEFRRP